MNKKSVLLFLLFFFVAVFVFSAVNLLLVVREYRQADALYQQVQNEFVAVPPIDPTLTEQTEDVPKIETSGIAVDFDKLSATNSDAIGWIYCADTPINYPVVQAADNSKYLHAGLDGKYLRSGTIFADYRNEEITTDRQLVLYGHSMKNKTMFGSLLEYKQQAYYDAHPVWYYLTPDAEYRIELFAGCVSKVADIIYRPNPDDAEYTAYIEKMRSQSTFDSDVEVSLEDTIVVLSTCSYEFDNARYVALGKLVKISE